MSVSVWASACLRVWVCFRVCGVHLCVSVCLGGWVVGCVGERVPVCVLVRGIVSVCECVGEGERQ